MSDRRPEKLSEKIARLLAKDDDAIALDDALGLLIEVQQVLDDPVAVVRRGVESGTIKGKVVDSRHRFIVFDETTGSNIAFEPDTYLVILVSDGGSET